MTKAKTTTPKPRPVVIKAKDVTPALQQLHWLPIDYRITYKLCLIIHLVHTKRAPQYLSNSVQQSTWSQILQHSCLYQAEVQNQVRRARLLACWTYCMEQSSTPSVILVFSSAVSKLNYFVEHTSLVLVSVNSAIEMTVLLLLFFLPLGVKIPGLKTKFKN